MSQLRVTTLNNASNTGTANITLDASGNATVAGTLAMGSSFKRNRIINGDMRVDQRNAGASVTPTDGQYTLDRWLANASAASKFTVQQNAGSITPPAGFSTYLGCTSSSAYTVGANETFAVSQRIEGFNTADFNWGASNAKTVTLSAWVYSSLTGTFGGAITNSAVNYSYPFSYSIPVANTWTQISITIAGPTSGTWVGATNGVGLNIFFSIGTGSTRSGTAGSWSANLYTSATGATSVVGTNGATFYITGVQLEVGSVATPYERQIYSEQLAQCQRYYYRLNMSNSNGVSGTFALGNTINSSSYVSLLFNMPVTMRVTPTSLDTSAMSTFAFDGASVVTTPTSLAIDNGGTISSSSPWAVCVVVLKSAAFTANRSYFMYANLTTAAYVGFSSEL